MSTYSKSYLECGTSSSKISGSEKNQEKIEYKTYKQQEKTSSNNNFDKSIITFDSDEEDEKENDQINKCFKNIQIQSNSRLKFSIETNKFTKAITTIGRNKFKEDLINSVEFFKEVWLCLYVLSLSFISKFRAASLISLLFASLVKSSIFLEMRNYYL